jgi:predicted dehydrogenase
MKRVRIGLIGCGDIATTGHLPALRRSPDAELVAVMDSDSTRSRAVADDYGCRVAQSIEQLTNLGVRAVVIATPPHVTPALSQAALAAGLDVLCEKPMAVDLAAALDVQRAVADCDRILQVGFKNRFSPLVRAVGDWISRGELGHPIAFTLGGFDESLDPAAPEHERRIRGFLETAPSFVHEGAHFADYLAFLTGSEPVSVDAVGVKSRPDLGSENFVSAVVRYRNGDVARMEIGWLFPTSPAGEFRALGPDGVAILDRSAGVVSLVRNDRTEQVALDRPWNQLCFDLQLAHFLSCVRSRATPEISAAAGVASLRLGHQVVSALRSSSGDPS